MTLRDTSPGSPFIDGAPLLLLNGAEERLQIALGVKRKGVYVLAHSQSWTVPGQAVQYLAPALEDIFQRFGIERGGDSPALGGIACVRGPGGFTGLRLVLSLALGVSISMQSPLAGVDYLPTLAQGPAAFLSAPTQAVWTITHARQKQVYVQGFVVEAGEITPLAPARAASLDEVVEMMRSGPQTGVVVGGGLRRNEAYFQDALTTALSGRFTCLPPEFDNPAPETLLSHALGAEYSFSPIEPLYLRVSDAEENLDAIARKQGLDPEQARRDLARLTSVFPSDS